MSSQRDLLLYVDDEEQALKYFRLTFAKDHDVLTATGADQAWPLVEQHADRLALVISDQRMPGKSGVELLSAVRERCPRAVRLLTTAYSDLDSAIAAVNRGAIYAYVTKPWKIEELRVVVRQALQLHHVQVERDALLAEKMAVFQELLLADRTRSLGVAVAGLAGQVRRPLAAAAAWLRDRRDAFAVPAVAAADARDLWPTVLEQSRSLAVLAGELGGWLVAHRAPEAPADAAAALAAVAREVQGATVQAGQAAVLPLDRALLAAGFAELLGLLRARLPDGARAAVQVRTADGAPILGLELPGGGPPVDADRAGLAAYLAIHHHLGAVAVPAWSATGGRVEVALGGAADDGVGAFLDQLARHER